MKTKHRPTRTCIACRQAQSKRALVRIVRRPDGEVMIDESGKANGRGAYLCAKKRCWQQALGRKTLNYALKITLTADTIQRLREYAQHLEKGQMEH